MILLSHTRYGEIKVCLTVYARLKKILQCTKIGIKLTHINGLVDE